MRLIIVADNTLGGETVNKVTSLELMEGKIKVNKEQYFSCLSKVKFKENINRDYAIIDYVEHEPVWSFNEGDNNIDEMLTPSDRFVLPHNSVFIIEKASRLPANYVNPISMIKDKYENKSSVFISGRNTGTILDNSVALSATDMDELFFQDIYIPRIVATDADYFYPSVPINNDETIYSKIMKLRGKNSTDCSALIPVTTNLPIQYRKKMYLGGDIFSTNKFNKVFLELPLVYKAVFMDEKEEASLPFVMVQTMGYMSSNEPGAYVGIMLLDGRVEVKPVVTYPKGAIITRSDATTNHFPIYPQIMPRSDIVQVCAHYNDSYQPCLSVTLFSVHDELYVDEETVYELLDGDDIIITEASEVNVHTFNTSSTTIGKSGVYLDDEGDYTEKKTQIGTSYTRSLYTDPAEIIKREGGMGGTKVIDIFFNNVDIEIPIQPISDKPYFLGITHANGATSKHNLKIPSIVSPSTATYIPFSQIQFQPTEETPKTENIELQIGEPRNIAENQAQTIYDIHGSGNLVGNLLQFFESTCCRLFPADGEGLLTTKAFALESGASTQILTSAEKKEIIANYLTEHLPKFKGTYTEIETFGINTAGLKDVNPYSGFEITDGASKNVRFVLRNEGKGWQ